MIILLYVAEIVSFENSELQYLKVFHMVYLCLLSSWRKRHPTNPMKNRLIMYYITGNVDKNFF